MSILNWSILIQESPASAMSAFSCVLLPLFKCDKLLHCRMLCFAGSGNLHPQLALQEESWGDCWTGVSWAEGFHSIVVIEELLETCQKDRFPDLSFNFRRIISVTFVLNNDCDWECLTGLVVMKDPNPPRIRRPSSVEEPCKTLEEKLSSTCIYNIQMLSQSIKLINLNLNVSEFTCCFPSVWLCDTSMGWDCQRCGGEEHDAGHMWTIVEPLWWPYHAVATEGGHCRVRPGEKVAKSPGGVTDVAVCTCLLFTVSVGLPCEN